MALPKFPKNDEFVAFARGLGYTGTYNDMLFAYLKDRYTTGARGTLADLYAQWDGNLFVSPDMLSGNVLWLDASDTSTITHTGGLVDEWADKSPEGNDAIGTGVNRPTTASATINGLNTIDFDSTGDPDYLVIGQPASLDFVGGTDEFTFISVLQAEVGKTGTILSKAGLTSSQRQYQYFVSAGVLNSNIGGTADVGSITIVGDAHLVASTLSTTTHTLYVDGILDDSAAPGTNSNSNDVMVGARRGTDVNTGSGFELDGKFGEVIMYNRVLNSVEFTAVSDFLIDKWGIT